MTRNLNKLLSTVAMAGMLGGAGCLGGTPATTTPPPASTVTNTGGGSAQTAPTDTTNPANAQNTASGGASNTFSHEDDSTVDPFQVLARIQEEGPPEVATRMHSCGKMKYATLGNLLTDVGIDPTTGNAMTAGGLYKSGAGALGKPDYSNRLAESAGLSTAGAVRLYDIFVAAVPGIVAAMPTQARCMVAGAPTNMFTTDGTACTMEGITCVTGSPATQQQKDLCDSAVGSSADMVGTGNNALTVGQVVAVASLMSAAHSCE
ncbi:MAG: hypothetical protein ABI321_15980 [Polyangia bacterium]